jgi:chromate transporter
MKSVQFKELTDVFLTFLKIGTFTFGGGYAMIPLIQHETVEKHGWISDDDIFEIVAIAESTPGPIAINAATFVGYRVGGFWGAFCATFGVVLPAFLIIVTISYVLGVFEQLRAVKYAFYGIRAGVLALILKAFWSMFRKSPASVIAYGISSAAFIFVALLDVNVLLVIALCAAAGLISSFIVSRRNRQ